LVSNPMTPKQQATDKGQALWELLLTFRYPRSLIVHFLI
jgi:hypothetical protein